MSSSLIGHHTLARLLAGWSSRPGPMVSRLSTGLLSLVHDGQLPAGTRLPSERALAAVLGISRNTVAAAFDELRATGALISRRGAGTFVTRSGQSSLARGDERLADYTIVPAGGGPEIDLRSAALPGLEIVNEAMSDIDFDELRALVDSHGYMPRGLGGLRVAVADYYTDLGLPTSADQVLITSGAQQGLRLAMQALLEPGSRVLVEDPTFRGSLDILRAAGAKVDPAICRLQPLCGDVLRAEVAAGRPAMMIVQSAVHNPLGTVMTAAEKRVMASISEDLDIPVVDDVALLDTHIGDPPPRPLAAYGGKVITVGSASKSFWGGLRIGWMRAESSLISRLAALKAGDDLGTSVIPQLVTQHLLSRIDEARRSRTVALENAREACLRAVAELLPGWEVVVPGGGASLWIRMPAGSASTFVQHVAREGVLLFAGPVFSAVNEHDDHIRIAYSDSHERVLAGIGAIARTWRRLESEAKEAQLRSSPTRVVDGATIT